MLVHFVPKFVLVGAQQPLVSVAVVAAVIVVEIVAIHVDISVAADNSNRVGAIVLYIVEGLVVDNIGIEVPVAVDSIDIGLVDIAKHKAKHKVKHMAKHRVAEVLEADKSYRAGVEG